MKDSHIYASMILSILSSSRDKQSAIQAVLQNFAFQGTLRLEVDQLLEVYKDSEKKMILEFINIIDQFVKNNYPYLAGIRLKPTRRTHSHTL